MGRPSKIKTTATPGSESETVEVGGWLQGRNTYLWLGLQDRCIGTIGGQKLYRLAKAIVRQWEEE